MTIFTQADLENLQVSDKINLINSLPGIKSVNLIGTKSKVGYENLAIFSSVIHLGSNPPLIGFIHRPKSIFGHTMQNIESTGLYTINNIQQHLVSDAHKTSGKFDQHISEFVECNLNPIYLNDFYAPFVEESNVKYGLELKEIVPIQQNGTFLIIGEVITLIVDPRFLTASYTIDHMKAGTIGVIGVDEYIGIQPV